jgi:hypothetical protein
MTHSMRSRPTAFPLCAEITGSVRVQRPPATSGLEPEEDDVPRPLRHPVVESKVVVERELDHLPQLQQPDHLLGSERPHPPGRRITDAVEPDLHAVAAPSRLGMTSTASWAPTRRLISTYRPLGNRPSQKQSLLKSLRLDRRLAVANGRDGSPASVTMRGAEVTSGRFV